MFKRARKWNWKFCPLNSTEILSVPPVDRNVLCVRDKKALITVGDRTFEERRFVYMIDSWPGTDGKWLHCGANDYTGYYPMPPVDLDYWQNTSRKLELGKYYLIWIAQPSLVTFGVFETHAPGKYLAQINETEDGWAWAIPHPGFRFRHSNGLVWAPTVTQVPQAAVDCWIRLPDEGLEPKFTYSNY